MTSRYTVVLHPSEEGFAVSCPSLPGCWSQGANEQESLDNIQDAIREYLAAVRESANERLVREVEVTV
jgi:predicted RNase H-like HicB family nuclease